MLLVEAAVVEGQLGDLKAAERMLDKALKLDPGNADAWYNWARWRAKGASWSAPCDCSARPSISTRNIPTPHSDWAKRSMSRARPKRRCPGSTRPPASPPRMPRSCT
jgi:tetratricopeptide (TPR) repeat protein